MNVTGSSTLELPCFLALLPNVIYKLKYGTKQSY